MGKIYDGEGWTAKCIGKVGSDGSVYEAACSVNVSGGSEKTEESLTEAACSANA